jgi:hypothetical protein
MSPVGYLEGGETIMALNDMMEFDHVIEVHADGSVTDANDVYAPDLFDDELMSDDWTLLNGYSGQSGYSGPIMHNSEFIGGQLERDILAEPGYYVALVNNSLDDDEPEGWAVAYRAKESYMTWDEAYERFDDCLNEAGPVTVIGLEYYPARVLREVDPTAYRTYFNDWTDSEGIDTDKLEGVDRDG